ncbi:MAG: fibronectin type III domain-containing protein [Patescibacteria group bacterium]
MATKKTKKWQKVLQALLIFALVFVLNFNYIPLPSKVLAATQNIPFTTAGNYTYDDTKIQVTGGQAVLGRSPAWWDTDYAYRKKITVTAGSTAITTDDTLTLNADIASLVAALKMQANQYDLRIVYWNGSANTEIDRDYLAQDLAVTPSLNTVRFKAQAAISATESDSGYYLYYDNDSATSPPENYSNVYEYYEDFSSDPSWTVIGADCASRISVADGKLKKTGVGPTNINCLIADQTATMDISAHDYYLEVMGKRTSATTDLMSVGIYDNVNEGDNDIGVWWWGSQPSTNIVTLYSGMGEGPWTGETITVSQNVDTRYTQLLDVQSTWRPTCGDDPGWLQITGYLDGTQAIQQATESLSNCANRAYPTVHTWDDAEAEWDDYKAWKSLGETASAGSEETIYPADDPVITNSTAVTFDTLSAFSETATKNGGEIKYILSNNDGSTWSYYSGGWIASDGTYSQANTASDIDTNVSTFPAGSGQLLIRAFFHSDGTQEVSLDNLSLTLNNYPEATFDDDFSTWQSGDISVNYNLVDYDSDTSNISQGASSGLEYSVDGSSWTDATMTAGGDGLTGLTASASPGEDHVFAWDSATDLADTEDSSVYLQVRPNDGTDNASAWATSSAFGVDNKAPSSVGAPTFGTLTSSSIVLNKPSSVTENGSGLSTWQVRRDGTTALTAVSNSTSTKTDSSLNPNTQYTYDVRFTDSQGNTSSYGTSASVYTLANVPGTPTLVSTATTVTLSINNNDNPAATSFAIYEAGTGNYVQADGSLGPAAVWQTQAVWGSSGITITGLSPETTYSFQVKAKNGDGVESEYSTTEAIVTSDRTVISNVAATQLSSTSVKISWTTNHAADSRVLYGLTTDYGSEASSATLTTLHEITITGLTASTTYHYKVFSTGNTAAFETDKTFILAAESAYLASPTIVFPEADSTIDTSSPTITGLARSNNTIFIFIDNDLEKTVLSTDHPSDTGSFFYKIRRNLSNGVHSVYTIARNADGVYSDRSPKIYFTVALPYITPTLFEPIFKDGTNPEVIIRGVARNDSLIKVYVDGQYVDEFAVVNNALNETPSFAYSLPVSGLGQGSYEITVRAFDLNGKSSRISNALNFTKTSAADVFSETVFQFIGKVKYTVAAGDSLWKLAERFYGNGRDYTKIIEANKFVYPTLSSNPGVIQIGWQLSIP